MELGLSMLVEAVPQGRQWKVRLVSGQDQLLIRAGHPKGCSAPETLALAFLLGLVSASAVAFPAFVDVQRLESIASAARCSPAARSAARGSHRFRPWRRLRRAPGAGGGRVLMDRTVRATGAGFAYSPLAKHRGQSPGRDEPRAPRGDRLDRFGDECRL